MAVRYFSEAAFIRNVATVWDTIQRIAADGKSDSPRTCWHAVGIYLHQHPETKGMVWFYGAPESDVNDMVFHVMLTDVRGNVLRDTMKTRGGHPLQNGAFYQLPDSDEQYEMMAWKRWPAKG